MKTIYPPNNLIKSILSHILQTEIKPDESTYSTSPGIPETHKEQCPSIDNVPALTIDLRSTVIIFSSPVLLTEAHGLSWFQTSHVCSYLLFLLRTLLDKHYLNTKI